MHPDQRNQDYILLVINYQYYRALLIVAEQTKPNLISYSVLVNKYLLLHLLT